jgi:dolichol-phosphate mannosyltransferase
MPELSVILPAYQEADNLAFLLPALMQVLAGLDLTSEVLVLDTCQPRDATREVAQRHGARWVPRGPGDCYGDAYRTAIAQATGEYILFMDADGSHAPGFLPQLLAERATHDVVMASRYVAGGGNGNGRLLVGMSRLLNLCYGLVLGIRCQDLSNSFKLYRRQQLLGIRLSCRNFDVIPEILLRLKRAHPALRMKELPFRFEPRVHGVSKRRLVTFILTYLATLARLRWSRG